MVLTGPVIRRRIALLMAIFLVLFLVLGVRLFDLQILQARSLQTRAQAQWTSESSIRPTRGRILDRNGTVLAQSATAYTLCASPRLVRDAQALAHMLSPVIGLDADVIAEKVSDRSRGGVTLKRQLPREIAQELRTLIAADARSGECILSGLYLEEESRRYYPMGDFACQL